jgi:hypothetical protein
MRIAKIVLILLLLFVSTGCNQPRFQSEESVYIVWKTPSFRYADQGFVYRAPKRMRIEIYGSGQALMRLDIEEEKICSSFLACTDKRTFNEKMLSRWYPESILEDIFNGRAIMNGEGVTPNRNGFTQNIRHGKKYEIHYTVLNNTILFHDTINKIFIKVVKQ